MALPLPNVISNVGPGGPLVTAMGGMNAYNNALQEARMNAVKAQYAPLTVQSEAASKLAYANLMGPQFLAKLMGNPDVVANSQQLQDPETMKRLYQAGMGAGTGNAMMNMPGMGQQQDNMSPLHNIINSIRSAFGFGGPQQQQSGQQPMNAMLQNNPMLSQQDRIALSNQQPGQSYQVQGNPGPGDNSGYAYDKNGRNIKASPQEVSEIANNGNQRPRTYAENAGNYAGTKEELKEAGKIRAEDIKELNDTVFNAQTKQETLNDINNMISSPEIREIRQLPLAGRHEMGYYAKEGTPAQQQLVGRLYAQMGNIVKDSSRDFAGQFRKGEQQLLHGMKPNDSDTIDAMIGKAESLSVMNKILMERSRRTSEYMSKNHFNKLQASEIADKEINGDEIRRGIHDKLNPTVTIKNRKTGETKTIPVGEARQLGVNNV